MSLIISMSMSLIISPRIIMSMTGADDEDHHVDDRLMMRLIPSMTG